MSVPRRIAAAVLERDEHQCVIAFVWDPTRDFQLRGDVGIDVYSIDGLNERFRPRTSI